jgi:HEAT repeat protein
LKWRGPVPFVKGDAAGAPRADKPAEANSASHIAALASPDAETRWSAARALGGHVDAVAALAAALALEKVTRVREAMMTALMRVGDEASVAALLPYLRSRDAGERAAAIEALQALPQAISPFMGSLLGDADSNIRTLAAELARNMPAADATRLLCGVLEHEQHPNVCAAAIEVLAEVGTPDAIPALRACAKRFAATPFLPFAASMAIARLSGAGA